MAKKVRRQINPRSVSVGDRVKVKSSARLDKVKSISIVLHLENGIDDVYRDEETITIIEEEAP